VEEQAVGAGNAADRLVRRLDLVVREEPGGLVVEGRAAEQADLGVAVEIDLLEEVGEFVAVEAPSLVIAAFQFCAAYRASPMMSSTW
jgi:hypothetical protein